MARKVSTPSKNGICVCVLLIYLNIYSSKVYPFFFVAQYRYAKNVIKMPIADFVSLADEIGDPTVPVVWISNTGRCGGTMLCQVFETVPGTLVMHECDPPISLWHLQADGGVHVSDTMYDSLLKSSIRFLTCTKAHPDIKRICIKPRPQCIVMMKDITRLLPNIRQLFLYRNSFDTIKSWLGAMHCEPYLAITYMLADSEWFSKLCPYFRNTERYYFNLRCKTFLEVPSNSNPACLMTYLWSHSMLIAQDAISRDSTILPIRYEDISARPKEALKGLFDSLHIDASHVDKGISSMERDSQEESVMSRSRLASEKYVSTANRIKIDAILSQFKLPLLGSDFKV